MGEELDNLNDIDIDVDGGRLLDGGHWCRIAVWGGPIVLETGRHASDAAVAACAELRSLGVDLDMTTQQAICDGVRLQVFGR